MRLEGKMVSLRNEFTFYDNKGVELGSTRNNIIKFMGKECWVKNGVEFMRIYGDLLNNDYRMEVNGIQWFYQRTLR
jgi:uncharacterized protein YxjI